MNKFFFIIFTFIGQLSFTYAQPNIQWQKCLGGAEHDYGFSIQQTIDNGYIVAGNSFSNDGDVSGHHGSPDSSDYWVVKLDSIGNIDWQKSLGGTGTDEAYCIQQTNDGGYIAIGYSSSNDGDVSNNHGGKDVWVVKLYNTGNIQWQKCFGGTKDDGAYFIQQMTDEGFIVAGYSKSNDGDVTGHHGSLSFRDYWIVKLDSTGNLTWQKSLGGTDFDEAHSIQFTNDGGFIIAGMTFSNNNDVSGNHGIADYWVIKLDNTGNIQWQKCLGGTDYDYAYSIKQTNDYGYIVTGWSQSDDLDTSGIYGYADYWVVKLDNNGNILWQENLGGSYPDGSFFIDQSAAGGYIIAGSASSNDYDVSGNHGNEDFWIVALDTVGNIQWQKCYGGFGVDVAYCIRKTSDNGYIVAGHTFSANGDVSGNHGTSDFWIIKLYQVTSIKDLTTEDHIKIFPNPANNKIILEITQNYSFQNDNAIISNIQGQTLLHIPLRQTKTEINVSYLTKGLYFLKYECEDKITVKKFIKE